MTDNAFAGQTTDRQPVDSAATPIGDAPARPVAQPVVLEADPNAFTHYVWLADGRVLRAALTGNVDSLGSRHYETDDSGAETSVPIVGVYAR
jgi:hypothetical protein